MSNHPARQELNHLEALKEIARRVPETQGGEDATESIIGRIMNGATVEDVLTPANARGLGDNEGETFTIHDIRRVEGGRNSDLGFYLLVDATSDNNGRRDVYSTGAINVVTQLLKLYSMDAFPVQATICHVQSKKDPGRTVQWLVGVQPF